MIINPIRIKVYHWKKPPSKIGRIIALLILVIVLGIIFNFRFLYSQEFILTDYNFTNQEYTLNEITAFIRSYDKNQLTAEQIYFITWQCRYNIIHPVPFLAKMESESGIICNNNPRSYKWREHRAMGYGLYLHRIVKGKKYYKYGFFEVQVSNAAIALRKYFDRWKPGKRITLKCNGKDVYPGNAASYTYLIYTPYWGEHRTHGYISMGTYGFKKVYEQFLERWETVNKK